jgi:hypothetical protein
MRKAARVTSIHALKDFKRALDHFATQAITALGEGQADVRRTMWWIENEQLSYWKSRRRKREARLAEAKSELFRAQVAAEDSLVSATIERRAVEKAQAAVDEVQEKLANIKRWSRVLEREIILYRGECQQLSRAVEGDVPQALVRLEKMIEALERYVQLKAPTMTEHAVIETVLADSDRAEAAARAEGGEP